MNVEATVYTTRKFYFKSISWHQFSLFCMTKTLLLIVVKVVSIT